MNHKIPGQNHLKKRSAIQPASLQIKHDGTDSGERTECNEQIHTYYKPLERHKSDCFLRL